MSPFIPDRKSIEAETVVEYRGSNFKPWVNRCFWVGARLKLLVAAIILSAVLAGGVAAGEFEDGLAAYASGNYALAVEIWEPAAEEGSVDATVYLGSIFKDGKESLRSKYGEAGAKFAESRSVSRDEVKSYKWFRMAAEQGNATAQLHLGLALGSGLGVPKD